MSAGMTAMRVGLSKIGGLLLRGQRAGMSTLSSPADPYDLELKIHLGSDTIEYYKASSVLGKLTSNASAKTEAAVAKTEAAVAKTLAAVAKTEAAVAKETEARIKVIELTRDLLDANTENLRLKGMLDVRGMIEEIERLISPGMFRDPDVTRYELWYKALKSSPNNPLADVLIACFPTQKDINSARAAAISTIKRIYKKASNKIHSHIDSNNVAIVVHLRDFPGDKELDVIRALAKFHKFKIVEEK
jgi:hypothetical protein